LECGGSAPLSLVAACHDEAAGEDGSDGFGFVAAVILVVTDY